MAFVQSPFGDKAVIAVRWFLAVMVVCLAFGLLLSAPVFAQGSDESAESQEVDIKEQVQEAADEAKKALESIPDPAQAATQATEEQLSQGTPEREDQFVYSVSPWTGTEFAGTFAPKDVDTIYLVGDTTSIVNTQVTEVYFWPITGEYMANWFEKREEVEGALEVLKNGEVVETFEKVDYAYYYPQGYSGRQELLLGEEAVEMYEDYQSRIDAYYDAVSEYYDARTRWQQEMDRIIQEVRETGEYKDPDEIPQAPKQPEPPKDFVYQPRKAFAINLPPGTYQVRLRDGDGNIVAESEKTFDVFEARRTGTGYAVVPEHKWTRRFQSNDPSDTFYLDGRRVFYILPFEAKEYNYYKYVKMANLHKPLEAEGTRSAWIWVHGDPVTEARLEVVQDGEVIQDVEYTPYYVKQTPGYALGYEIVEFDPESDPSLEGRSPTFQGYRVELEGTGSYQLRFVDGDGNVLEGSERAVRSVKRPESAIYIVPLIPLVVGLIVFAWRRSKAGRRKRTAPVDVESSAVGTAAGKD